MSTPEPTALTVSAPAQLDQASPSAAAAGYAARSRAQNTKRAYTADWAHFSTWCAARGRTSLPATPTTVGDYLSWCADGDTASGQPALAVATLSRRLAAIGQAHQLAGHETPSKSEWVRTVMKGIRRTKSTAQRQAAPAVGSIMRQWVQVLPTSRLGTRDRALLLLGFAGAFRRSELASLDVSDLRFVPDGVIVTLRHSKTDQEGQGATKGIKLGSSADTCPVRALQAWIKAAELVSGPLFRPLDRHGNIKPKRMNAGDIATVIKRTATAAGFDAETFSGHSLRAGFATAAAAAGASDRAIKQQTGHKSDRVLQRYIREGSLFRDNASGLVGL